MVNDARGYFERLPWQMIAPGLCIACTAVAANLGGDAVWDALAPRTRGRRR